MTNQTKYPVKIYIAFLVCKGVIVEWDYDMNRSTAMEYFEADQHFFTSPQKEPKLCEGYFCEMQVDCDWDSDQIGSYLNTLDANDLRPYTMFSWDNRYTLLGA